MSEKRLAVVTGAARGIGRAIVLELLKQGREVAGLDINTEQLKELEGVVKEAGFSAITKCVDITDTKEFIEILESLASEYGGIGILVNNAGISPFVKKSEHVTKEEWESVIRINLTAPFLLCREAGKNMLKNKWGRIINVASVGGLVGLPRQIAYSATKGGLIQMTRVLAVEWIRQNITVNAIAPGYMATDLTEGMRASKEITENLLQRMPIRRFGEADEIAGAALFLASESASYTTGTVIVVDGGWMAS